MTTGFKPEAPYAGAGSDSFDSRLLDLRHHFGMTVQDFADKIGAKVTRKGTLDIRGLPVTKIAKACNVNDLWLYAGSNVAQRFWPVWWNPPNAQHELPTAESVGAGASRSG